LLARIFDVEDARVVVTGAGSGLGRAMAEGLARCGARTTLLDVNESSLDETLDALTQEGCAVTGAVVDITDARAIDTAIAKAAADHGGLDVVFANAGGTSAASSVEPADQSIDRLPESAFRAGIELNLDGAFYTMQAAARIMRPQRSGRIIVTASNAGLRPDLYAGFSYVAAKAGLINVVRQAALDLARFGVRVNAIAPGPFKTNIGGPRANAPETIARWSATVPLGRMGEPSEIQGLALFLASPASSFVTGSVFVIDGGAVALSQAM
jgi:NAD(P)-dependent dehydrogenase (short-subunit alcohol dehydrogenase family)